MIGSLERSLSQPCYSGAKVRALGYLILASYDGIIYNTIMNEWSIVLDTNVLIAALRSRRGASHRLLTLVGTGVFDINISVPLILEYEAVAYRLMDTMTLTKQDINDIIDYLCAVAHHRTIYYLWRPFLKDPKDDMILEVAVTSQSHFIVSFNQKDFRGVEQFGLEVLGPQEFLQRRGVLP